VTLTSTRAGGKLKDPWLLAHPMPMTLTTPTSSNYPLGKFFVPLETTQKTPAREPILIIESPLASPATKGKRGRISAQHLPTPIPSMAIGSLSFETPKPACKSITRARTRRKTKTHSRDSPQMVVRRGVRLRQFQAPTSPLAMV